MEHTVFGREAELANAHTAGRAPARGLDTALDIHVLDTRPHRSSPRVLIWDDEPEAQAPSGAEFVGPPPPGLKLAPAFFDQRAIDYGVQTLDWD